MAASNHYMTVNTKILLTTSPGAILKNFLREWLEINLWGYSPGN